MPPLDFKGPPKDWCFSQPVAFQVGKVIAPGKETPRDFNFSLLWGCEGDVGPTSHFLYRHVKRSLWMTVDTLGLEGTTRVELRHTLEEHIVLPTMHLLGTVSRLSALRWLPLQGGGLMGFIRGAHFWTTRWSPQMQNTVGWWGFLFFSPPPPCGAYWTIWVEAECRRWPLFREQNLHLPDSVCFSDWFPL